MRKLILTLVMVLGLGVVANAQESFLFNGDNNEKAFTCTKSASVQVAAAATGVIVTKAAGKILRVCGFVLTGDTAATTATLSYGTGTTCGTGNVALSGGLRFPDEEDLTVFAPLGTSMIRVPAGQDFCLAAATGAVSGFVTYALF